MSEATVLLKSYTPAEGNRPHKFIDGNDTEYTTFKDGIANAAKPLVGERVLIKFTEKHKDNFTNRYIDGVEKAAAANGDHPPLGTGEYVKGQQAPTDARRILVCSAWDRAVALTAIEVRVRPSVEWTSQLIFEAAQHHADQVFLAMVRKSNPDIVTDEDIAFG